MSTVKPNPISDEAIAARDRLLQSISQHTDLPALGSSVSRVVQLAASDDDSVRNLAYLVLSDVALSQKILLLANTVCYRTFSSAPVTTISKAIFLLGFDTVKTSALAIMLVEGMSGKRAHCVRAELAQALTASVIGREIARRSHFKDAEEAAVAALFKNMGRLLVAAHDHRLYEQIGALVDAGSMTPTQASMQVLGCSFDMLGESVLQEWQIPDTIIQALAPLQGSVLKTAKNRYEWMQQVATFSATTATLLPSISDPGRDAASRSLISRFGVALNLDEERFSELCADVVRQTRALSLNADLPETLIETEAEIETETAAENGLPAELLMQSSSVSAELRTDLCHPSGKPVNARELLLAGVQDVTEMMASGRCPANDLIMLALETLYRSLGFRFATFCVRDMKTQQFRARIALGESNPSRQAGFLFGPAMSHDLFNLALENDADLMIADASEPKIRRLIPDWHRKLLPDARSFIVLPLIVKKIPFGLFYADRAQAALEGVPPDETSLIKTLKGQVLAALHAR